MSYAGIAASTTSLVERVSSRVLRLCGEKRVALLTLFSLLYFAGSGFVAFSKPLEFDEIYTLELAKLGFGEIVTALNSGLDVTPPLYNWINRIAVLLLGESRFAIRLPSLIGCWAMALFLFVFVSRRLPAFYAFLAMLCPFWLSVRVYAFDARPYGLMLGLSAAALLLWQCAVEVRPARRSALAGLAICMAAGSSIHFYFVLLLIPLAIGEGVRSIGARRVEIPVWPACFSCLLPLPFHRGLISDALSYSDDLWSRASWRQLPDYYIDAFGSLFLPGGLLLCCTVLYLLTAAARRSPPAFSPGPGFRPYELAALLGFMIVPLFAISTAVLLTGMFVFRYALITALGASILIAFATSKGDRAVPFAGCLLFFAFSLNFAAFQLSRFSAVHDKGLVPSLITQTQQVALPIVIAEPIDYLEVVYAAPPAIAARLYYVADAGLAKKYTGSAGGDRGLLILQKGRPLNVRSYAEFIATHREFLVYSKPVGSDSVNFAWLLAKLADDNRQVYLKQMAGREALYHVALPVARP